MVLQQILDFSQPNNNMLGILQIAFFNPENNPSRPSECSRGFPVPLFVHRNFVEPESRIALRKSFTDAAVPKATVNENRELAFREDKIGFARKGWIVHFPTRDSATN